MIYTRVLSLFAAFLLSLIPLFAQSPAGARRWALPSISVANMRSLPSHSSELVSQALMGMPVMLIKREGQWWLSRTPDGYEGWINVSSLAVKSDKEMQLWRSANRAVVSADYETRCYANPDIKKGGEVLSDLVNGDIVELRDEPAREGMTAIRLPDKRDAWVKSDALTPIAVWASQKFDAKKILNTARSLMGVPYLWGGTSTKSLDCSGLTKVCYLANGIILKRDASQQAKTGKRIEPDNWQTCREGDLVFFGNRKTGKVNHVGIYEGDGQYIHSSGRVKRNSLDSTKRDYLPNEIVNCARINGMEDTPGIVSVASHPWYFNQ